MQRLQQQEAEMAARIEQQKQLAQMRQMQLHGFPQVNRYWYDYCSKSSHKDCFCMCNARLAPNEPVSIKLSSVNKIVALE